MIADKGLTLYAITLGTFANASSNVTVPEAAIYFILDFKNIINKDFTTSKFVDYCASDGKVKLKGKYYTVLLAPMDGFYTKQKQQS